MGYALILLAFFFTIYILVKSLRGYSNSQNNILFLDGYETALTYIAMGNDPYKLLEEYKDRTDQFSVGFKKCCEDEINKK